VAKVKVINNSLDQNLNGSYFNNTASETIFSFGKFSVTSNFDSRKYIDYTNTLSSFVRTVTLETMGVSDVHSEILNFYSKNAVLNLDKSDINTFVRFGSAYEFLRISVEKIINKYPASLYISSQVSRNNNVTYVDYVYDEIADISTFKIPINAIINTFELVYNYGNLTYSGNSNLSDDGQLRNLNLSYLDYIIWSPQAPDKNNCVVLGYTGNTTGRKYLTLKVQGDPFSFIPSGNTSAPVNFHIKPNNFIFEGFRSLLDNYEKYMVSERTTGGTSGFKFTLKDPTLLDNGTITYSDTTLLWTTSDRYNIDINTPSYQKFFEILLTIGAKYDTIKTDLIARFLTPASLKQYDLTEAGKMTKLLKIYGAEFDQLREFIDSLVNINKVTYNKVNNIPDQLIMNMSRTFGWDYFSLVNETELVDSFLTIDDSERNLNSDLLPAEIDVELWRRILMNTSYFWKSKGTREAIKSMFLLIGIPEPFINITEYVYTVEGKINPNTVPLTIDDFPSYSLPYDTDGYPIAPLETNDFYFQLSGNTDSGQAYLDVFRMVGFNLQQTPDNKKSWIQTGATTRIDDTTPQYYQEDSRLVINTKEVDVALDTARGIEYDVYDYIKNQDFVANSSGYTLPYSYVNISVGLTGATQTKFKLPAAYDKAQGDLEVRYNGILLNAPKEFSGGTGGTYAELIEADYSIDLNDNTFTLLTGTAYTNGSRRDVVQATYIYSGTSQMPSGLTISVDYIVTRVKPNAISTVIPLPSYPRGDVQVTINGIALTKGTPQFAADYILDPANSTGGTNQIIISNPEVVAYLTALNTMSRTEAYVQVAYVQVTGSNDINARSEVVRIDSFNSSKIYFNSGANKYVYKLNYKVTDAKNVKFLIDGIALEPYTDYNINIQNPYEIFLPKGLRYGSVISAYYLVANSQAFAPVVADSFGIGDISQLSFLEFIELIRRKMINARNRQTISDFKGGWYPALLRIYEMYLERSTLPAVNPLQSNGYTFQNLYPFLSKYNTFFQRFVDQLLSTTIILKRGGLLIRNSVFTQQKHWYKRGVNVANVTNIAPPPPLAPYYYGYNYTPPVGLGNLTGRAALQYLGDDGSLFIISQENEPDPFELYVETKAGTAAIGALNNIGGKNIVGYEALTSYGIQYKKSIVSTWTQHPLILGSLPSNTFSLSISGLLEDTTYNYRAIVKSNTIAYTGNTLSLKTLKTIVVPVTPSGKTKQNTSSTTTTLVGTGGYDIQRYGDISWYGMQYSATTSAAIFNVTPNLFTTSNTTKTCNVTVVGEVSNTFGVTAVCGATPITWLLPEAPDPPTPVGITQGVLVQANTGAARTGCTVYTPLVGTAKIVEFRQASGLPTYNAINVCRLGGSAPLALDNWECSKLLPTTPMSVGQCYLANFSWSILKPATALPATMSVCLVRGGTTLYCCAYGGKIAYVRSGTWNNIELKCSLDGVCAVVRAESSSTSYQAEAIVVLTSVSSVVGSFSVGSPNNAYASVGGA